MFNLRRKNKYLSKNILFNRATYRGFILKKNFWYGELDGKPVALCGRVCKDGKIAFYTLNDGQWEAERKEVREIKRIFPNFKELKYKEA